MIASFTPGDAGTRKGRGLMGRAGMDSALRGVSVCLGGFSGLVLMSDDRRAVLLLFCGSGG